MTVPTRAMVAGAALALALALASGDGSGHGFIPAWLDLRERVDGRVEVLWKVPLAGEAGAEGREAITPHLAGCREVARGEPLDVPMAVLERFTLDCGAQGLGGRAVSVSSLEGRGIDVLVQVRYASGTRFTTVLHADAPSVEIPPSTGASPWRIAKGYLSLGVEHIVTGFDHLLFVLGLTFLVRDVPALVRTVTAFTVGHSVTLALASLGLVRVASAPVEAVIALSILLLAAELAIPESAPTTWTRRRPWLVALGFGLLHGFGFAGALREVGLPEGQLPLALLAFNGGVEVGQLAFVLAVWALRALVRRTKPTWSTPARALAPYVIGVPAAYWLFARVASFV